jgi:Spindle and kinetochore-associated protein 1
MNSSSHGQESESLTSGGVIELISDEGDDSVVVDPQLMHTLTDTLETLARNARLVYQLSDVAATCDTNPTVLEALQALDASVNILEERVAVLSGIVNDEKAALVELETTQWDTANEISKHLSEMLQETRSNLPSSCRREEGLVVSDAALSHNDDILSDDDDDNNDAESVENEHQVTSKPANRLALASSLSSAPKAVQWGPPRLSQQQRRAPRQQQLGHDNTVTRDELDTIPRTTRGRISLSVLNEALRDIESVCRKRKQSRNNRSNIISNNNNSSKPPFNLNLSSQENSTVVWTGGSSWIVREHDLRQSCSFFRNGESTARTILLLLRTLGHLQQVPDKTGDVKYIVTSKLRG